MPTNIQIPFTSQLELKNKLCTLIKPWNLFKNTNSKYRLPGKAVTYIEKKSARIGLSWIKANTSNPNLLPRTSLHTWFASMGNETMWICS